MASNKGPPLDQRVTLTPYLVKAMRPHAGKPEDGELVFKKDVEIAVFEGTKDGDQLRGELKGTDQVGWFPAFNVKKIPGAKPPEVKFLLKNPAKSASPPTPAPAAAFVPARPSSMSTTPQPNAAPQLETRTRGSAFVRPSAPLPSLPPTKTLGSSQVAAPSEKAPPQIPPKPTSSSSSTLGVSIANSSAVGTHSTSISLSSGFGPPLKEKSPSSSPSSNSSPSGSATSLLAVRESSSKGRTASPSHEKKEKKEKKEKSDKKEKKEKKEKEAKRIGDAASPDKDGKLHHHHHHSSSVTTVDKPSSPAITAPKPASTTPEAAVSSAEKDRELWEQREKEREKRRQEREAARKAREAAPQPKPQMDISLNDMQQNLQMTLRKNRARVAEIEALAALAPPPPQPQPVVNAASAADPPAPAPVTAEPTPTPAPTANKPAPPLAKADRRDSDLIARMGAPGGVSSKPPRGPAFGFTMRQVPGGKAAALHSAAPPAAGLSKREAALARFEQMSAKAAAKPAGTTAEAPAASSNALGRSNAADHMSAGKRADWMVMSTLRAPRHKAAALGSSEGPAPATAHQTAMQYALELEQSLEQKWAEFVITLPQVPRRGRSYKEKIDEQEQARLETDAKTIVSALLRGAGAQEKVHKEEEDKKPVEPPVPVEQPAQHPPEVAPAPVPVATPPIKVTDTTAPAVSIPVPPKPPAPPKLLPATRVNMLPAADLDVLFGVAREQLQNTPGIHRWRIEQLLPVRSDPNTVFQFCVHECYLVLVVPAQTKSDGSSAPFNLHYWMGSKATLDKSTCAAIRATQLNSLLGSICKHYREEHKSESALFKSYFNDSIHYTEEGASASAFRVLEKDEYDKRLYRISEKRVNEYEVELLAPEVASLNKKDSFLIDTKDELIVWNGSAATLSLRFWAQDFAAAINIADRASKCKVSIVEEADTPAAVWKLLGASAKPASIASAHSVEHDENASSPALYVLHEVKGKMQFDKELDVEGLLDRNVLQSHNCYILDMGKELFQWQGKKSKPECRKLADQLLVQFRDDGTRPKWAAVLRCFDGAEPALFRAKFRNALKMTRSGKVDPEKQPRNKLAAGSVVRPLSKDDYLQLLDPPLDEDPHAQPKHDPSGVTQAWLIVKGGSGQQSIPDEEKGQFYSGDCYLILYVWNNEKDNAQKSILYFWQGKDASNRVWPMFLLSLAPMIEDKIVANGYKAPEKVRVLQQKEPAEFIKLFGNTLIIHKGKRAVETKRRDKTALYHLKSYGERAVAIETQCSAQSLQSNSAFIALTPEQLFIWKGQGCSNIANAQMLAVSMQLQGTRTPSILVENEENEDFWKAIGGKSSYACDMAFWSKFPQAARLYQFLNLFADMDAKEILHFNQSDLNGAEFDVFLLDTQTGAQYLWTPRQASDKMMQLATQVAKKYNEHAAQVRNRPAAELVMVTEGKEPREFIAHFHGWTHAQAFADPYAAREEKLKAMMAEETARQAKEQAEKAKEEAIRLAAAQEERKAKVAALQKEGEIKKAELAAARAKEREAKEAEEAKAKAEADAAEAAAAAAAAKATEAASAKAAEEELAKAAAEKAKAEAEAEAEAAAAKAAEAKAAEEELAKAAAEKAKLEEERTALADAADAVAKEKATAEAAAPAKPATAEANADAAEPESHEKEEPKAAEEERPHHAQEEIADEHDTGTAAASSTPAAPTTASDLDQVHVAKDSSRDTSPARHANEGSDAEGSHLSSGASSDASDQ